MADGDWRAALPEQIRDHASLKDVKDVAGLAQRFIDTSAHVGQSIRPLGPDASPEQRADFIAKLQKHAPELVLIPTDAKQREQVMDHILTAAGKPKDATGYAVEGVQAGEPLSDDELKALRERAAKRGWTQKQFASEYEDLAMAKQARSSELKNQSQDLRREWAGAYDERLGRAAAVAEKMGASADEVAAIKAGRVPAAVAKTWFNIAAATGGEQNPVAGQHGGGGGGGGGGKTKAELEAQRAEIRGRKEFWERHHNPAVSDSLRAQDLALAEQLEKLSA